MHGLNFHNCLFVYIMKISKLAWLNMPECDAVSFSSQYEQLVPLEQIKSKKKKIRSYNIFFILRLYRVNIQEKKDHSKYQPPLPSTPSSSWETSSQLLCPGYVQYMTTIYYIVLERKSIQKDNFMQPILLI